MTPTRLPETASAWHGRVWALAWPTIIANSSIPLVGMVDTAVVGHLPESASMGAVAIGAVVFNFLLWIFAFLRMGTTGFAAQALGAGDWKEINATAARALGIALVVGIGLTALKQPIEWLALHLVPASPAVEASAAEYLSIRLWAAPAAMLNLAALGVLFGIQDMRGALWSQLVLNLGNALLDVLFVWGLGWGVAGVAWATVIALYLSTALAVWLVWRGLARQGAPWTGLDLLDPAKLRALTVLNASIFLRTLAVQASFFYFTAAGARQGDDVLAANAVLLHLFHLLAFALDGFAFAVEALAGQTYGARQPRALRAVVVSATVWALAVAVAFAGLYALGGMRIVRLMTSVPGVLGAAEEYIGWVIVAPLLTVWAYLLDGVYFGTTRSREMRNGMLISTAIYFGCIYTLVPWLQNHGLWLSVMIFMLARAVFLAAWYPRIERTARP